MHTGSVKKEVIRSDDLMPRSARSSESQNDEESISNVLDDVMQYFDFLDDAENSSAVMDSDKISVALVKGINVDRLPSDFNHFLIRHFSHCIQLLDDLKFMNKSQLNTHFKLSRLEAIILEKISVEASTLKNFLKALIAISNQSTDTTFDPLITEILSTTLTNSNSSDVWLNAISIEENSKDMCILNADKSKLLANMNDSFVKSSNKSNRVALNSLINRLAATSASNEEDQQHVSISVYHFIAIQNLIDANSHEISLLNEQLECLQENPSKWLSELDPAFVRVSVKEKSFCEAILVSLVHKTVLEKCQETRAAVDKFIATVNDVDITRTVDAVLSLVLETLLGFNLKSKPSNTDIEVLKLLNELLRHLNSRNEDLVDSTVLEFIDLQIDNQTSIKILETMA